MSRSINPVKCIHITVERMNENKTLDDFYDIEKAIDYLKTIQRVESSPLKDLPPAEMCVCGAEPKADAEIVAPYRVGISHSLAKSIIYCPVCSPYRESSDGHWVKGEGRTPNEAIASALKYWNEYMKKEKERKQNAD